MIRVKLLCRYSRFLWRLIRVFLFFLFAGMDAAWGRYWKWDARERSRWQGKWAGRLLRWIGFDVQTRGNIPSGGFIVSNHVSYMDIVVLASLTPQVFLAKSEVANWPVIGWYTRVAGTLFIDRGKRSDVANKGEAFSEIIEKGLGMTVFLEGTSTDGSSIKPYRSSLLQPAIDNSWEVTPVYVKYECVEGDVKQDVCWWGDMEFGEHLMRLLKVKRIFATVVFGESVEPVADRKAFAGVLYEETLALQESVR